MDETAVHDTVIEILKTSNLDSITLRQVVEQVETKLGSPSKPFKTFIKRTVDDYLNDPDAAHAPSKKAKKTPSSAVSQASPAADKAGKSKPAADATPPDTDGTVHLSDKRSAIVSSFKGKMRLDVREFYVDANGERKHSSKGLSMASDQVDVLLAAVPDIQAAVEAGDNFSINLAPNGLRRATVSRFKSNTLVSLREYYNDASTGEAKPGKRGISLSIEQWGVLSKHLPALAAALRKAGG